VLAPPCAGSGRDGGLRFCSWLFRLVLRAARPDTSPGVTRKLPGSTSQREWALAHSLDFFHMMAISSTNIAGLPFLPSIRVTSYRGWQRLSSIVFAPARWWIVPDAAAGLGSIYPASHFSILLLWARPAILPGKSLGTVRRRCVSLRQALHRSSAAKAFTRPIQPPRDRCANPRFDQSITSGGVRDPHCGTTSPWFVRSK